MLVLQVLIEARPNNPGDSPPRECWSHISRRKVHLPRMLHCQINIIENFMVAIAECEVPYIDLYHSCTSFWEIWKISKL
jgi:hypothetical protein